MEKIIGSCGYTIHGARIFLNMFNLNWYFKNKNKIKAMKSNGTENGQTSKNNINLDVKKYFYHNY